MMKSLVPQLSSQMRCMNQLNKLLRYSIIYINTCTVVASQAVYETAEYSFENRNQCSVVNTALSTLKRTLSISYEEPVACNTTENLYEMQTPSPYEMAQSMEAEQQIYETPCEDEEDYGPIYCMPPSDEEKIYVEFEGKRFRKLYRREIE